jgi:hypothetical protein
MRAVGNGIGSLLVVALLAVPGSAQAESLLIEGAAGLSGLATSINSGLPTL